MKNINLVIILFLLIGCKKNEQPINNFITVDITANYPKKEMILQDFMDVEYISLETTDEFICQGFIQAIGKDMIIAKNRSNDGNIYIYNREGKALRKIIGKDREGKSIRIF